MVHHALLRRQPYGTPRGTSVAPELRKIPSGRRRSLSLHGLRSLYCLQHSCTSLPIGLSAELHSRRDHTRSSPLPLRLQTGAAPSQGDRFSKDLWLCATVPEHIRHVATIPQIPVVDCHSSC